MEVTAVEVTSVAPPHPSNPTPQATLSKSLPVTFVSIITLHLQGLPAEIAARSIAIRPSSRRSESLHPISISAFPLILLNPE